MGADQIVLGRVVNNSNPKIQIKSTQSNSSPNRDLTQLDPSSWERSAAELVGEIGNGARG